MVGMKNYEMIMTRLVEREVEMGRPCKGTCKLEYQTMIPQSIPKGYEEMLFCYECDCRIKITGQNGPCCGTHLRFTAVHKSKARKLEIEMKRY